MSESEKSPDATAKAEIGAAASGATSKARAAAENGGAASFILFGKVFRITDGMKRAGASIIDHFDRETDLPGDCAAEAFLAMLEAMERDSERPAEP